MIGKLVMWGIGLWVMSKIKQAQAAPMTEQAPAPPPPTPEPQSQPQPFPWTPPPQPPPQQSPIPTGVPWERAGGGAGGWQTVTLSYGQTAPVNLPAPSARKVEVTLASVNGQAVVVKVTVCYSLPPGARSVMAPCRSESVALSGPGTQGSVMGVVVRLDQVIAPVSRGFAGRPAGAVLSVRVA